MPVPGRNREVPEDEDVLHFTGEPTPVRRVPVGSGSTEKGNVEMIKPFISPYLPADIVFRARLWVGRPITRAEWHPGETCLHMVADAYGWQDSIPVNWKMRKIVDLEEAIGWTLNKQTPIAGDLGVFMIHGHEHLGIFTDGGFLIHAGVLTVVEAIADRFMKYYEGVLICP